MMIKTIRYFILFAISLIFVIQVLSQNSELINYTNGNEIPSITIDRNEVLVGTNGGLVFIDNAFLLIEELSQHWNNATWVNDLKFSYSYDANNNQTERIYENWNGTIWVNVSKFLDSYDSNNNLTEELRQNWDGANWVISSRYLYTYDADNNQTEWLSQNWDGDNWVNQNRQNYSYSPMTNINHILNTVDRYQLSQNYPNPFNSNTTIEFSIPKSEFVTLKIYNLLGQEIATVISKTHTQGSYKYIWDASGFASGIYYYKMITRNYTQAKKILLIK